MQFIKDFKLNKRGFNNNFPTNFTIASSHHQVIHHTVVNVLNKNDDLVLKPEDGFNLLERNDYYQWLVIALGIGCDALPGGINNVGTRKQNICKHKWIQKNPVNSIQKN